MSDLFLNARDFVDDMANAGPGIQAALNAAVRPAAESPYYYGESGGIVRFPCGTYIVNEPIVIPLGGNFHLEGCGGPWLGQRPCVIEYRGGESALFEFEEAASDAAADQRHNGFLMSGFSLRGRDRERVETAFLYRCGNKFNQGFTFERCGFYYFGKVLDVALGGGTNRMGMVRLRDCEAHDNKQFIDSTAYPGGINMLRIQDSYISRNVPDDDDYVIDLMRPYNVLIQGCCLEGQTRTLRCVHGSGITVDQCYWEGQRAPGPAMRFENCRGLDIGAQHYHRFASDGEVFLSIDENCEQVRVAPQVGRVETNVDWKWRN